MMEEIIGKVIQRFEGLSEGSEEVTIWFKDGSRIVQMHHQDCCEHVDVSQVDGNAERFIGATVNELTVKTDEGWEGDMSYTSTFYTLSTSKGYLDWRWQGESNGYYSEEVSMFYVE